MMRWWWFGLAVEPPEIRRALEPMKADGRGGVVALVGDAGVGKSRLLTEIEATAAALELPALSGRAVPGGGAVPYQIGRFEAPSMRRGAQGKRFSEKLRNIWFDTTLYTPLALELLIKTVGADRCLFATECPGTGTAQDPATGRSMDDVAPYIKAFDWLADADKTAIFEGNARKLFKLDARLAK